MGNTAANTWTIPDNAAKDLVVIVTGASSGLGLECARQLALHGAHVTFAVRNLAKTQPLIDALRSQMLPDHGSVAMEQLDTSDLDSVRAFATAFKATHTKLDILLNNAGIFAERDHPPTPQGLDKQMATNHYGPFLLTVELIPLLVSTPGSRVVDVCSGLYRQIKTAAKLQTNFDAEIRYEPIEGFARSKLATLLAYRNFNLKLREKGFNSPILLNADPGMMDTNAMYANKSMPTKIAFGAASKLLGQSVHDGALPILRACLDPVAQENNYLGPTGKLSGAPVLKEPSPLFNDDNLMRWVWTRTIEKTGVDVDVVLPSMNAINAATNEPATATNDTNADVGGTGTSDSGAVPAANEPNIANEPIPAASAV